MVIKHVERRVRLSDSHIKKLRQKDKLFSVGDSEVPGLRIYVETSGTKNFYYCYKPKNEKNWVRIKLGNFTLLNVPGARAKAKRYGAAILDGKDPVIARREFKDGKYHGQGTYTKSDGTVEKGIWENGKLVEPTTPKPKPG